MIQNDDLVCVTVYTAAALLIIWCSKKNLYLFINEINNPKTWFILFLFTF